MRLYKNLILIFLCLCCSFTEAQLLDKKITLECTDIPIADALKKIKKTYGIHFSYVNNIIPADKKVTIKATNAPLKEVLDMLFSLAGITYELIGDQVVLKKDAKAKTSKKSYSQPKNEAAVATSNKQESQAIQESAAASAETIPLPDTSEAMAAEQLLPIQLEPLAKPGDTISKRELRQRYKAEKRRLKVKYGYQKDSISKTEPVWGRSNEERLRKAMEELKQEMHSLRQQLDNSANGKTLPGILPDSASNKQRVTASDSVKGNNSTSALDSIRSNYLYDPFQISLISPIGTDGTESWHTVNHISINIIAGCSAGLDGAEAAGIANIETDFMHGAQFAGVANVVKNEVQGVQYAGVINLTGGYVKGVQYAGVVNVCGDSAEGIQGAGFCNVSGGSFRGVQGAGFCNVNNGKFRGLQGAGFCNVNKGKTMGVQISGFCNVNADSTQGTQLAGFANVNKQPMQGTQIAGFINVARKMKGAQIGVINIADSLDGAAIGIISIVKKNGYRRLEMYSSEAMKANVAFKMGVRGFYNIFYVGAQQMGSYYRWGWGYGIGSEAAISKKMAINFDALCIQVNENQAYTNKLNLLNQLKVNLSYALTPRIALFAGPSCNVMVSQYVNKDNSIGSDIVKHGFYNNTSGATNVRIWVGFNGGIRF